KPPLSALQQQVHFNASASDISKDVNKVSQRLQQLTLRTSTRVSWHISHAHVMLLACTYAVVRQTNMFNDPTSQINELTQLVKQDITLIHTKLDDLEVRSYSSQHAAKHSDAIVTQMKSTLMNTTKGFKDILQVRQENLQHQHDRKSQYGRGTPSQQFVVPDQGYADSRAEAVTNIQSHIVELGELFQRLSVMISAQGESVRIIDENVDDAVRNVDQGTRQLEIFRNNLSNSALMMKVGGILLVFVVLFLFFMA
ncbi:hypothetical protein DYB32_009332, partial [Aphanomyces invadans]